MYITRAYSILVQKDLKLQHIIFNLSPYLKWKKPQELLSSLGSYFTDTEEGPTASDHFSISPWDQKVIEPCGKVHVWGINTAEPPNCPLLQKEANSTNKPLLDCQPRYFYSPSAHAALLCLCNVKDEAALELQVETEDFRKYTMKRY